MGGAGSGAAPRARPTPYELVFGQEAFEGRIFPRIEQQAVDAGLDPLQPDEFALVPAAAAALRDFLASDSPPDAREQYHALLYHAFNFWAFGRRFYLLEAPVARYLVEAAPTLGGWEVVLPGPSIYVQLPANLFWGSVSPDAPPEPVDGFFAAASGAADLAAGTVRNLEVLMVLGIRRDRAGFSVVPCRAAAGPGAAAGWAETPGRDSGSDFENLLPGGEIGGLYSILTVAEALKLVARTLWYLEAFPVDQSPESVGGGEPSAGAVRPSRLPYRRVSLDPGGAAS